MTMRSKAYPVRLAPIFMPVMIPLPSMLSGPTSELGPYSIEGSTMRGSIMVRNGIEPCIPPVAMITARRARMVIVSARSSMLPFCQKLSSRNPLFKNAGSRRKKMEIR
jgi:hypothetical protein